MTDVGQCRVYMTAVVLASLFSGASMAHAQDDVPPAAARAASARVEPGDEVIVKISREPLLGDTVIVNARGEIALAKIGTVLATSMSIRALEDTIRARYAQFLREPAVNLLVLRRVAVNGEVSKPNVYYVDVATTLRDVIARAGGITEIGDESRVSIVRRGVRIAAPAWREDYSLASDLHSGDEIVVGRRSWLSRNAISFASTAIFVVSVIINEIRR